MDRNIRASRNMTIVALVFTVLALSSLYQKEDIHFMFNVLVGNLWMVGAIIVRAIPELPKWCRR